MPTKIGSNNYNIAYDRAMKNNPSRVNRQRNFNDENVQQNRDIRNADQVIKKTENQFQLGNQIDLKA